MPLTNRDRNFGSFSVPGITDGVKLLLIINVSVFLLMFVANLMRAMDPFMPLGLVPYSVVHSFAIWQLFTYMFLHSPTSITHILFNMLMLWMFGPAVEGIWGKRRFLRYYILCGLGAGVSVVALNFLIGNPRVWTIGASGALYGVLIAFGLLYAESTILFMFIFPMKAKWAAFLYGGIAFFLTVSESGGPISNIAHLGGFVTGLVIIKLGMPRLKLNLNPVPSLRHRYKEWKFQRAKRKFQVYLRKSNDKPDRWVN